MGASSVTAIADADPIPAAHPSRARLDRLWRRRDPRLHARPVGRLHLPAEPAGAGALSVAVQQTVNALSIGAIYALIALGYTMVYGIIELINFAHGDIFMLGAFGCRSCSSAGSWARPAPSRTSPC